MIPEAAEQTIDAGQMPTTLEELVPFAIALGCGVGVALLMWVLKRLGVPMPLVPKKERKLP